MLRYNRRYRSNISAFSERRSRKEMNHCVTNRKVFVALTIAFQIADWRTLGYLSFLLRPLRRRTLFNTYDFYQHSIEEKVSYRKSAARTLFTASDRQNNFIIHTLRQLLTITQKYSGFLSLLSWRPGKFYYTPNLKNNPNWILLHRGVWRSPSLNNIHQTDKIERRKNNICHNKVTLE